MFSVKTDQTIQAINEPLTFFFEALTAMIPETRSKINTTTPANKQIRPAMIAKTIAPHQQAYLLAFQLLLVVNIQEKFHHQQMT